MKGMTTMDKVKITRKDGITYERKEKECNYDAVLYLRCRDELLVSLKKLASKKDISYTTLARQVLEKYVEREIKNEIN